MTDTLLEKLYVYKAKVLKVIDGDTLQLDIDLGMCVHFVEHVRLIGINTPETYGVKKDSEEYKAGIKAKEAVISWVEGKDVIIETSKDKKEKYGRYLVKLYFDNICLNDKLISENLAKPYFT